LELFAKRPDFLKRGFTELLGVSVRTLQDWEQGIEPYRAARTLIAVAANNPSVLLDVA
jgi:putative transcriptional regulator